MHPAASPSPPALPCASAADRALVARIARDDEDAVAILCAAHAPAALAAATRLSGDAYLAALAVEDAFLRAWRTAHLYDGSLAIRDWMLALVAQCLAALSAEVREMDLRAV